MSTTSTPRVAIVGAGPVGLDAALAAAERGWPFTVYERGRVGEGVRAWGHVRLFSPWSMNLSGRMERALEAAGHPLPDAERHPTGDELVEELLEPLASLPEVAEGLRTGVRVAGVGRAGLLKHEEISSPERASRPFRLLLRDADGRETVEEADVVLDCTGGRAVPNPLGADGIPAPGEEEAEPLVEREIPGVAAAPDAWAGRRILLVGGGHSAQTAARDLARLADGRPSDPPRVYWSVRSADPDFGVVEDDPLPARSALGRAALELAGGASDAVTLLPGTQVRKLERDGESVRVTLAGYAEDGRSGGREGGSGSATKGDDGRRLEVDRIVALTGAVGDASIYRALQIHECYASSAPMKLAAALLAEGGDGVDCLDQTSHGVETLENPEPDFYILGAKSYGRNSTFLLRVGYEQVDEVFGAL